MPTYDDLRAYFEESPLREIVARAARMPIVSGFTLDVDPLWSIFYDLEDGLIDRALWPAERRNRLQYFAQLTYGDVISAMLWLDPILPIYQGYRRRDLRRQIKEWEQLWLNVAGSRPRLPVILTVAHRPLRAPAEGSESIDETQQLRTLVGIVSESKVFARIEERPPARLAFAGGDRIRIDPSRTGTLGGFLHSNDGTCYGVTCSHVAQQHDAVSDDLGQHLGTCVANSTLVSLPDNVVCDPVNLRFPATYPGNGPDVNMLDCSLVKLASPSANSSLASVASQLSQGLNVVMRGAETPFSRYKLGSLCISYQFKSGGNSYCFRDAIELVPEPRGPFGGKLGQLTTVVPVGGDSGSWVLTDDTPAQWAGLFFGEDGRRGFAIRAAWAFDWAKAEIQKALTL